MGYRFTTKTRVYDNDALIAFIDLLGTRKFYGTGSAEQQAKKILRVLLSQFDICFSRYLMKDVIEENFDVSIFADSIVVSQRKGNSAIVERLVDFTLGYQANLLLKSVPSRATLIKDSFFSFKVFEASQASILGSQYTTISLCGGRGIKLAHDSLEGLPLGVYISERIMNDMTPEQQKRTIPVKDNSKLFFIKQKSNVLNFLQELSVETFHLLSNNPDANNKAIRRSLKMSHLEKEALKKLLPWVLAHLGRQNKIHRQTNQFNRTRKRGG